MNACDIVAYVGDGEILCPDCGAKDDDGSDDCIVSPIFADSDDLHYGETCGSCGAFYRPDNQWSSPRDTEDYQSDLACYRWITCDGCNHTEPRDGTDSRVRLESLRGKLTCPNCRQRQMHF